MSDGSSDRREVWAGLDTANVMSLEILSGILVWGGAGWLLDGWIGTTPWLFAIGVLLGFGGGLYLVWLRSGSGSTQQAADDGRARDDR